MGVFSFSIYQAFWNMGCSYENTDKLTEEGGFP
jgi:hypothetical protein